MKTIKWLIPGLAAGLFAVSGTQAAHLPVKAKAVEYVRICSLYGAGFFYIPSTDTCIKLGGYLRADVTINGGVYDFPFYNGEGAFRDRYANFYTDCSRVALTVDTRTATEYGVVRTFGQAGFSFGPLNYTSSIGLAASVNPGATAGLVNIETSDGGFGKSFSAFFSPWHGYPGNNTSFLVGGFDSVTGVNNVQYSRQFGNGVSATIGVDDSSANNVNRTQNINAVGGLAGVNNGGVVTGGAGGNIGFSGAASAFVTGVGTAYGGSSVPDFVGNIRVDQAWGMFQISDAVHDNHAAYFANANDVATTFNFGQNQAGAVNFGHPSDVYGGAVSAALLIKNVPTGVGDDIRMDANWSKGASK